MIKVQCVFCGRPARWVGIEDWGLCDRRECMLVHLDDVLLLAEENEEDEE